MSKEQKKDILILIGYNILVAIVFIACIKYSNDTLSASFTFLSAHFFGPFIIAGRLMSGSNNTLMKYKVPNSLIIGFMEYRKSSDIQKWYVHLYLFWIIAAIILITF